MGRLFFSVLLGRLDTRGSSYYQPKKNEILYIESSEDQIRQNTFAVCLINPIWVI